VKNIDLFNEGREKINKKEILLVGRWWKVVSLDGRRTTVIWFIACI